MTITTDISDMHPYARNAIVGCLLEEGFARADADLWGRGWHGWPDLAHVATTAIAYDDHGVPVAEAVQWNAERFLPHQATRLHDLGWTPDEAAEVRTHLAHPDSDLTAWAVLGLRPVRVVAYLRAGVSLDEAETFELSDPPSVATLNFMAAIGS